VGAVHTLALKLPPLADQTRLFVAPPLAVAAKATWLGAMVWFAGEMLDTATLVGVTTHVVVATSPDGLVTVSVYVLVPVNAGVLYVCPLVAEAVISELPVPVEPITAVPPEKVGTRVICELKPGAITFGTKVKAISCRAEPSHPLMANDSSANAGHFSNPKRNARL